MCSRRISLLSLTALLALSPQVVTAVQLSLTAAVPDVVREIGDRRELFVDRFLVDRLQNAELKLHSPQPAPAMTQPADNMEYGTVIRDGDLFRLYTRDGRGAKFDGDAPEVTRYCESRDGIHWSKLRTEPVITWTREYAFDSQNVSFWSESEGCYVCYFRHFLDKQLRSICRTTSQDFVNWTDPVPMRPNFPGEHLYTSLTHPYFRAPHLYIATPTRFHPSRGESTDILLMTARGGSPFDRTFREAFIRPGLDPARWGNRSNYAALNIVQTGAEEMSIYVTPFRRFTMRLDGFASVHAGADPGELVTHPLKFSGNRLLINYSTSAGGAVQAELQTPDGRAIPGFALADCRPIVGDAIEHRVIWGTGNGDLSALAGQPVRLRFVLTDADVFSLQFAR